MPNPYTNKVKGINNPYNSKGNYSNDLQLSWLIPDQGIIPSKAQNYSATFTRASSGTYIDKDDGILKTAAPNIIREETAGYLIEPARQNIALFTQAFQVGATWVPTNITVGTNTQVAPDSTTTMDTLTATAANATILQTITSSANNRVFSIYIKRKTGTGNIDLTVDNGATWTTVAVTTTTTRWTITQAAVTNPVIGIRIVTDTDAIYVWQADMEEGLAPTSSIFTTTIALARTVDDLQLPIADGSNFTQAEGTLLCNFTYSLDKEDMISNVAIVSVRANLISILFASLANFLYTYDDSDYSYIAVSLTAHVEIKCFVRWGSLLVVGADGTQGTNPITYSGAFQMQTHYRIGYGNNERMWIKNIRVYNIDKGQAFCEAETA